MNKIKTKNVILRGVYHIILCCIILSLPACKISKGNKSHYSDKSNNEHIHIGKGSKRGKKVVAEALEWEGTPYKYASSEKGIGADCSGMVMSTYLEATGIKLPRNSAKQAEFCKKISANQVEIGDLCFFATGKDPEKISHVGIMIDEERFIHSSTSKGVVISNITTPYYQRTFIQFGRVPDE